MKWLTESFTKEGPGIPKDAAKKTGLALFGQIVLREWWELFKLNLAIVLFSLPLVTIPAAFTAAVRVSVLMIEDENIYLIREFRAAFLAFFVKATLWGSGFAAVLALGGYASFVYSQMAVHALVYALPFAVAVGSSLFSWIVAAYLFVLMVRQPQLPPASLLRLSVISGLSHPLPALVALAFISALWLLHILFYPASAIMPAAFNFSLGTLALVFSVYRATDFSPALDIGRSGESGKFSQKRPGAHNRRR